MSLASVRFEHFEFRGSPRTCCIYCPYESVYAQHTLKNMNIIHSSTIKVSNEYLEIQNDNKMKN